MIINIKYENSLITIDTRLKEIRDFKRFGFYPLSNNDIEGFIYLYENNLNLFLNCLIDVYKDNGIKLNKNELEVLKC
jgi:hypothetical protein